MKKIFLSLSAFVSLSYIAQNNVGIGTLTPNPQAVLEIESNDKGVLISRLTTTARNTLGTALTNAEDGMLVYDKDLTTFFYWDGPNLQWVQVGSGNGDNWGTQVVQTTGTNISGDGTAANPLTVTDNDNDPNNEIELPATANNGEVLTWDGTNWIPQVAPSGADNWGTDIVNTTGTNISGDGTASNPLTITEVDGDITNEIQDLSLNTTTNILTITNNGTAANIDLSPYLDNTDAQTLSLTGNTLTISNGNNVTLTDNVNDADADPNNEIELPAGGTNGQVLSTDGSGIYTWINDNGGTDNQDLSLTGNLLSLTNDGTPVDLSGYLDNTDSQNLTSTVTGGNATINISGGTGTTFSINDADADPTNEHNTGANLTGNNLNIIDGGGTQTVDLSGLKDHDWYEVGGTTKPDNINDNIYTQGNVGIAINAPISPLHTFGGPNMTSGYSRSATFHANHPVIQFKGGSNTNNSGFIGYDAQASVEAMRFWTGATGDDNGGSAAAKMSILANGDVGINTTAPTSKLHVNGGVRTQNIGQIVCRHNSGGVTVNVPFTRAYVQAHPDETYIYTGIAPDLQDNVHCNSGGNVGLHIYDGATGWDGQYILTLDNVCAGQPTIHGKWQGWRLTVDDVNGNVANDDGFVNFTLWHDGTNWRVQHLHAQSGGLNCECR